MLAQQRGSMNGCAVGSCRGIATSSTRRPSAAWAKSVAVALFAAAAFAPAVGSAQVKDVRSPPTALEKLQLPQYCQWQMDRENPQFQAPQFRITHVFPNCGVGTNHYCPGLLAMVRANRPGADRRHRGYWIERAGAEFLYTSRAIKPYPNCGLHGPLDESLRKLEVMAKSLR
jgi:hypothetical protein